jgi:hypothetical protein
MPLLIGTKRALLRGAKTYTDKVLSYGPIAYWPLNESAGSVARCYIKSAQNGAYTGVALGQTGIGDGNFCPSFDGAGDVVNVYSTTLRDAFSSAVGTLSLWAQMANVGVWTDGAARWSTIIRADAQNYVQLRKSSINNVLDWYYVANNVVELVQKAAVSETGWMHLAIIWDKAADQMKAYYAGAQEGATQTTLGVWAGSPSATQTCIGAGNAGGVGSWNGKIAHTAVYDYALDAVAIADLATV